MVSIRMRTHVSIIMILFLQLSEVSAEPSAIWIDVAFIKQDRNGCGAASIAMVMQYWSSKSGQPIRPNSNPDQIQQLLYSEKAKGIYAKEMDAYFKSNGFRTFIFKGEWTDLKQHLSQGRPLIVCIEENHKTESLHYLVVVGLDDQESIVLVNDPAQRKLLKMERTEFIKAWKSTHNWTLLAVPNPIKDPASIPP
jgi:ABC-type bacteriocin/lantibiotic exporter with double-glycine peptidase domain